MHTRIRKIVIVGGGTAGWLSAIHLSRFWKRGRGAGDLEITVVEAPDIPIVGVGEATTGLFTTFIRNLSNEREFLRETKASFKLGILHRDWTGDGSHYLGPLNDDRQLGIPAVPPETYPWDGLSRADQVYWRRRALRDVRRRRVWQDFRRVLTPGPWRK